MVTADGAVTKYFYDAEDVRIGAEYTDADGSTRTETFVTDRQSTYSRLLTVTSDAKTTTYSYGLGLTGVTEGSKTSYYHYNHLGSTTAITDSTGQVITRASYGTYGEFLGVTGEAGGETLRFLYNGRYGVQTEGNTLYYMRARYYNQDARRFVNLDPVRGELTNTQSLNRYAYVQGNPVRATDPLGLSPEEVEREIDVHLILGLLGCIPFAGAIFSAYDAYLYHKEGNYIMMAGSIVATIGSICGTGGAAAKYLSKCGIISPKTATIVQKTLMGISLGSGVGYTGVLFGNSISKAIDEKEENGTISSATWKEMIGTAAIHAITTALGVGAAKRMSSPVLKETAKNAASSTPTTTSATGTIAEVLDDGVGSVGVKASGKAVGGKITLKHKATSGVELTSIPEKTTTILGRYVQDTGAIIDELKIPKNTDFSGNPGGFNLLNTPDEFYITAKQFWDEYNKPWLDCAIARGDIFKFATEPTWGNLTNINISTGKIEITGFGREYVYLKKLGYYYDDLTKSMMK